jgi:uncharacterized membrane protein YccC
MMTPRGVGHDTPPGQAAARRPREHGGVVPGTGPSGPSAVLRRAVFRVQSRWVVLVLGATAAGISYLLASTVFGPEQAFFAPIAAILCVGTTAGRRLRRAFEITVGVAVGLTAADLLLRAVGAGPLQLALAVLAAMTVAIALGARTLMANQAAVAAVLVVALSPGGEQSSLARLADALIGGGVALVLTTWLVPDPLRGARRLVSALLDDLAAALEGAAEALRETHLAAAETAIERSEQVFRRLADLDDAMQEAHEAVLLGRRGRTSRRSLRPMLLVRGRLDVLAGTTRALARASAGAVRHGEHVHPNLATAVDRLADGVRGLCAWAENGAPPGAARVDALEAAALASAVLEDRRALASSAVVGQVRSGAVDVLRSTGMDHRSAVAELERVAGRADQLGR